MAASANFSQNQTGEIGSETPTAETSVPDPEKLVESSGSPSPHTPEYREETARDAAAAPIMEEKDSETFTDEDKTKRLPDISLEESTGKARIFKDLSFLKKLWLLAESDEFKTIWWDDGGRCIVIDEELFKVEVLGREGPRKVFQTESMKTFLRQLNQYGFTKLQGHLERSSSLPEFSAEEEAFAANRKLLVYFNLLFKRDYPQLLHHCKRRVALKRKDTAAPALQRDLNEGNPSSSQDAQGTATGQEGSLPAAAAEGTDTGAPVGPLPLKRPKKDINPTGTAPSPLGPAAAAGREKSQPLDPSLLPPSSCQNLGATLPFTVPSFTTGPPQQEPPQPPQTPGVQAAWAALPFLRQSLEMATRAVSMLVPPNWQPQAAPHCPSCTCSHNRAGAGNGAAP